MRLTRKIRWAVCWRAVNSTLTVASRKYVWAALEKDRENLFFIDVQARGAYPAYSARVFREKGVTIDKAPGDDEILKNTVDFVSFSYYASRCASAGDERQQ